VFSNSDAPDNRAQLVLVASLGICRDAKDSALAPRHGAQLVASSCHAVVPRTTRALDPRHTIGLQILARTLQAYGLPRISVNTLGAYSTQLYALQHVS